MSRTGPARVRLVASGGARREWSDAELVAGVRAGEREAADALYQTYARDVERMLARMCGQDPELADLMHDVFLRAFQKIGGVRDAGALRSWLVGVAVRRAHEHLRAAGRWRLQSDELPAEAPSRDPDETIVLRRVYAALDRLPPELRIPFALRRIEGMKLEEIAHASGVSLATTKRRLARAEARFAALATRDRLLAERMGTR